MIRKLFGGRDKEQKAPAPPVAPVKQGFQPSSVATTRTVEAINKLGDTEELLQKRLSLLEKKVSSEHERAKELTRAGNKKAALLALKKKKMYEGQLEQVQQNIMRVNEEQLMLESTRTQMETLSVLQTATQAAKQTMSEMKIENVDTVLDEINEQADHARMIQDALSNPLGAAADLDEAELLSELQELEAEDLDSQLLEPAPVPAKKVPQQRLPAAAAATAAPVAPRKTPEELELEALQAEMA